MSIISFSPFELTVIVLVITDISITIEDSSFILLYDEPRAFDEALVASDKNFLISLQLFALVQPLYCLGRVLTRSPKIGSGFQMVLWEQRSLVDRKKGICKDS
jgi:hypothetical protein